MKAVWQLFYIKHRLFDMQKKVILKVVCETADWICEVQSDFKTGNYSATHNQKMSSETVFQ